MPGKLGTNLRTIFGERVGAPPASPEAAAESPLKKGKKLPDKYKDEQYQLDAAGNVMAAGGGFNRGANVRTKYYTDEERDKSAVRTDEQGRLIDSDGQLINDKNHSGFVVSQDEGTLHRFQQTKEQQGAYELRQHHSGPIQGGKAAAAGEMVTKDGVIRNINDMSGHYQPDLEMTHQMVDRLQQQDVAMREQKLAKNELNPNGSERKTPLGSEKILWNEVTEHEAEFNQLSKEVADYEAQRNPDEPYDPAMAAKRQQREQLLKKRQEAQDLGLGMSNREAKVDLFNPKKLFTKDDWAQLAGNPDKIKEQIKARLGANLEKAMIYVPGGPKRDLSTLTLKEANDWIGVIVGPGVTHAEVDTKKARVQMTAEQFAQTGGNLDAILGKREVNAEIEKRRGPEPSAEPEQQRLAGLVKQLGGDAQLTKLGVDPSAYTLEEKATILSKGRVPKGMERGAPPAAAAQPAVADPPSPAPQATPPSAQQGAPEGEPQPYNYVPAGAPEAEPTPAQQAALEGEKAPYAYVAGGDPEAQPADPQQAALEGEKAPYAYVAGGDPEAQPADPQQAALEGEKAPYAYVAGGDPEAPLAPAEQAAPEGDRDPYAYVAGGDPEAQPADPQQAAPEGEPHLYDEVSPRPQPAPAQPAAAVKPAAPRAPGQGNKLDLRKVRPATDKPPQVQQAEKEEQEKYDNSGGDRALHSKLLAAWKARNKERLAQMAGLDQKLKTADENQKKELAAQLKILRDQLSKGDPMPSLEGLAEMPIPERRKQIEMLEAQEKEEEDKLRAMLAELDD